MPNRRPGKELHQVMASLMLDHAGQHVAGQVITHGDRPGRQIDAKAVFGVRGAVQKRLAHADDRNVNGRQRGAIARGGVFQAPRIGMGLSRLDSGYERNRKNVSMPEHFNYVVTLT